MGDLPTGTVTFLFTDVEGSTRLLAELGAAEYAEVLSRHREVIRAELSAHGGVEVDTQGDAFFCAFGSARNAVTCARRAQERLAAETPVRVRMGLHSGEPLLVDGQYVGLDVHRAARVAASGHGGQIVLSSATAALLEPGAEQLRDLGEHRLKDLSAQQRLYQLGTDDFPPLKTLHRTNLPVPATAFLGRKRALGEVSALVRDPALRLVTLTGPGGTGKTRLALQACADAADAFPGGVFWVPLATVREGSVVESAFAQGLGTERDEESGLVESVAAAVDRPTLVLVDNCEHLLDDVAGVVSPLLAAGLPLHVVATSREPLALAGERVLPVDPLDRSDAVALFRVRAEAAGSGELRDEAIEELCARLDDLPLAVEIAAARAATLPPELLLARLTQRMQLLEGPRDADERQRTLRATIQWSYDLLEPNEQRVLRRLAVFVGGTTLGAVEEVAEADVEEVASLVAKSLLRLAHTHDEPRYWMLETIREFAHEQLAGSEELEGVRDRHLRWFADLAATAAGWLSESDAPSWLERLEADLGNLRAAFARAVAVGHAGTAVFACVLAELHLVRGRFAEAHEVLLRAVELTEEPVVLAQLHRRLGEVLVRRNDLEAAAGAYETAEQQLGRPGDRSSPEHWRQWLELRLSRARYEYWRGDVDALTRAAQELGVEIEEHGTARQRASFANVLVQDGFRRERYALSEETERLARSAFAAAKQAGDWDAPFLLGFALLWRGLLDEADALLRDGREAARAVGDPLTEIRCLVYRSIVARKRGDVGAARALDDEIEMLDDTFGYGGLVAANRAWLALREGCEEEVERWGAVALSEWASANRSGPTIFQWTARFPLLAVDVARDRLPSAAGHALRMLDESQQPLPEEVKTTLRVALERETREAFGKAVEAARPAGYT